MANTFTAQVEAWVAESKLRLDFVFRESIKEVIRDAQTPVAQGGRMPVRTGFLRNNVVSGINGAVSAGAAESYIVQLLGSEFGDSYFFGWRANYARYVEYGARGRAPRFFLRGAVQQWGAIVARNVARAREIG